MTTSIKKEHVRISAGRRNGSIIDNAGIRVMTSTGVAQGGTIEVPGSDRGDEVLDITNWTDFQTVTEAKFGVDQFYFTGPNELTYIGGADYTGKTLQIFWCKIGDD